MYYISVSDNALTPLLQLVVEMMHVSASNLHTADCLGLVIVLAFLQA